MKSGWSAGWNRYIIAVTYAVLGLMLRVPVSAALGTDVPYITFFPAIVLSTWYGGILPGIVTTLLSGAFAHVFVDGVFPSDRSSWIRIVLFLAMSGMMVWVIAELRNAQTRLEVATRQISYVLETIQDGFVALDAEWRYTYINAAAERMHGRDRYTLLGTPILERFPDYLGTRIEQAFRDASRTHEPGALEVQRSGRWYHLSLFPGPENGLAVYIRDITEHKLWESRLTASEERLRLALDAGSIGVWDLDLASSDMTWSDRLYVFHGVSPDSFSPTYESIKTLIHPDHRDRFYSSLRLTVETGQPFSLEFRVVHSNGETRWLHTSGRVLREPGGKPVRLLGATVDITERRREEEALRRSNADLEQFAYAASHDMQEPLRMASLYAQLLNSKYHGRLDSDADQYIGNVVQGVTRMRTLLRDVLAYSQVGTPLEGSAPECDAKAALEAVLLRLRSRIETTGALVSREELPLVGAQRKHVETLFEELIENSLEYRAAAPPRIFVGYQSMAGLARFYVRDNGIGIEPRYFSRVFQIFKRLHSYSAHPGSGVGLAICEKIVKRYGGEIWLESETGGGATFWFTLPLATELPLPQASADKVVSAS
jgi:PAS domain S-box-containing protein